MRERRIARRRRRYGAKVKGSEEDGDEKEVSTESYEDQDKLRPQMHANAARSDTRTHT